MNNSILNAESAQVTCGHNVAPQYPSSKVRFYDANETSPPYFLSPKLELTAVPGKDLGVVARGAFDEGEIIECCPTILLKYNKELRWSWLKRFYKAAIVTIFDDYLWWWKGQKQALLLGYGNLYNHSDDFNAVSYRKEDRKFVFVAKRRIEPGEEITVYYGRIPFLFQKAPENGEDPTGSTN